MAAIILPIMKKYSDLIFQRHKTVEYRKTFPPKGIDRIFVYESRGSGMIVGELEVEDIIYLPINELWIETQSMGGVSITEFTNYFGERPSGFGIVIKTAYKYEIPMHIKDFGISTPPQNYIYVREDWLFQDKYNQ